MRDIEKQQFIKKENLNQTHYFQSILQAAYEHRLLTDSDLENIQMQSIQLLTKQSECYTSGDSSSIKVETAEGILQSIFYSIGSYLKSFVDIDTSIKELKERPLLEVYQHGKKLIRLQVDSAKELLYLVQNDSIVTDNYAYNDTIQNGLQVFFTTYDIDFAAHDTPAYIDYPLSNDKTELVGIDYINRYLEKLFLENQFCKNFNEYDIHCLLRGYDEHSKDLLINIFGLVLTNLVGSLLINSNSLQLNISDLDRRYLQQKLENLSKGELDNVLQEVSIQICKELNVSNRLLQECVATTIVDLSSRLKDALDNNQLESIFISLKENYTKSTFKFEDGHKMNDELFRSTTDEIRECRYVLDKISIIKREIHSITDLIDILEGYCIFDNEFSEVFKSLGDMEIALLLKKIPTHMIDSNYHSAENEKEWHNRLNCFLKEIDLIRMEGIRDLSKKVNLD